MAGEGGNLGLNVPVGAQSFATMEGAKDVAKQLSKEARTLEKQLTAVAKAGKTANAEEKKLIEQQKKRLDVVRQQESGARNAVTAFKQADMAAKEAKRTVAAQASATFSQGQQVQRAYGNAASAIPLAAQLAAGSGARNFITGLTPAESAVLGMGANAAVGGLMDYAGAAAPYVAVAAATVYNAVDTYQREKQNNLDVRRFMADVNAGRESREMKEYFQKQEDSLYSRFISPQGLKSVGAAKSLANSGAFTMNEGKLRRALDRSIAPWNVTASAPGAIDNRQFIESMQKERASMIERMAKDLKVIISETRQREMNNPSTVETYIGANGEMVAGPHYNEQYALTTGYKNFLDKYGDSIHATPAAFSEMMKDAIDYEMVDGRRPGKYRFDPRGTPFTPPAGYRGQLKARMQPDIITPIYRTQDNTPSNFSYQRDQNTSIVEPLKSMTAPAVLSGRAEYKLRNGYTVARVGDDE